MERHDLPLSRGASVGKWQVDGRRVALSNRKGNLAHCHRNAKRRLSKAWAFVWNVFDQMLPLRWQIAAAYERPFVHLYELTMRDLRAHVGRLDRHALDLAALVSTPEAEREAYQVANQVMGPLLKRQGYRSLAQFERAYEETGGNPPWPKQRT